MIIKVKNPLTDTYYNFKNYVTGQDSDLGWLYARTFMGDDLPKLDVPEGFKEEEFGVQDYFTHGIFMRPEFKRFTRQVSELGRDVLEMFDEIVNTGQFTNNSFFLRSSLNMTLPYNGGPVKYAYPHTDHEFDHTNMVMYLTDAGGKTFVEGEAFDPQEDDIIFFKGTHWNEMPMKENRIVLVSTLFTW